MNPLELTYGQEAFLEIERYLRDNYHKGFTLSIYDIKTKNTIEVICDFSDFVYVIVYASAREHDFPCFIDTNFLSESYVVGMEFTRGIIRTGCVYEWNGTKLVERM